MTRVAFGKRTARQEQQQASQKDHAERSHGKLLLVRTRSECRGELLSEGSKFTRAWLAPVTIVPNVRKFQAWWKVRRAHKAKAAKRDPQEWPERACALRRRTGSA